MSKRIGTENETLKKWLTENETAVENLSQEHIQANAHSCQKRISRIRDASISKQIRAQKLLEVAQNLHSVSNFYQPVFSLISGEDLDFMKFEAMRFFRSL